MDKDMFMIKPDWYLWPLSTDWLVYDTLMNTYLMLYLFLLPGSPSVRPFWKQCAKCGLRLQMFWSLPYSSSPVMLILWGRPMPPVKGWHQVCDFWLFSRIFLSIFETFRPFWPKPSNFGWFWAVFWTTNVLVIALFNIYPVQSCLFFGGPDAACKRMTPGNLIFGYFLWFLAISV